MRRQDITKLAYELSYGKNSWNSRFHGSYWADAWQIQINKNTNKISIKQNNLKGRKREKIMDIRYTLNQKGKETLLKLKMRFENPKREIDKNIEPYI